MNDDETNGAEDGPEEYISDGDDGEAETTCEDEEEGEMYVDVVDE